MIRKFVMGASVLALTVGGLAVTAAPAFAKAAVHKGTLNCATSASTTFTPSLVLSIPDKKPATATKPAKPGKDKKSKILTNTTFSGCTGTELSAGLTVPTGGTTVGKSSTPSRLCTKQGSVSGGKTGGTFSDGSKFKEDAAGVSDSFLDGTQLAGPSSLNNHADDIPLPNDIGTILALLGDHGNDGLYILGHGGHSLGKAYVGAAISSVSHSPGIVDKLNACSAPAGLASFTSTGTVSIVSP